ncbi:hypothetical protein Prudu_012943, partial [Prunus dulcis]
HAGVLKRGTLGSQQRRKQTKAGAQSRRRLYFEQAEEHDFYVNGRRLLKSQKQKELSFLILHQKNKQQRGITTGTTEKREEYN